MTNPTPAIESYVNMFFRGEYPRVLPESDYDKLIAIIKAAIGEFEVVANNSYMEHDMYVVCVIIKVGGEEYRVVMCYEAGITYCIQTGAEKS